MAIVESFAAGTPTKKHFADTAMGRKEARQEIKKLRGAGAKVKTQGLEKYDSRPGGPPKDKQGDHHPPAQPEKEKPKIFKEVGDYEMSGKKTVKGPGFGALGF